MSTRKSPNIPPAPWKKKEPPPIAFYQDSRAFPEFQKQAKEADSSYVDRFHVGRYFPDGGVAGGELVIVVVNYGGKHPSVRAEIHGDAMHLAIELQPLWQAIADREPEKPEEVRDLLIELGYVVDPNDGRGEKQKKKEEEKATTAHPHAECETCGGRGYTVEYATDDDGGVLRVPCLEPRFHRFADLISPTLPPRGAE